MNDRMTRACFHGHINIVTRLLRNDYDTNRKDIYGWTPLMETSRFNHENIVKILLDHGSDPNVQDYEGWTALMWASYEGHEKIIQLLLEHDADPYLENDYGEDASILANNDEIGEIILQGSLPGPKRAEK